MDTISFNKEIKKFYADNYKVTYNKDVIVEEIPDGDLFMYTCRMWLNQPDRPIVIAGQYSNMDDFLAYVLLELKNKKFPIGLSYFTLIQTDHRVDKKDSNK